MQDSTSTERHDDQVTPNPHNGSTPEPDVFRFARPDELNDKEWAQVRTASLARIAELVGEIDCGRAWCVLRKHPEDHAEFHASDIVNLADYHRVEGDRERGWWGYLVENREGDRRVDLVLEGFDDAGEHHDIEVGIDVVSVLLAAVRTKQAHNDLLALIQQVGP